MASACKFFDEDAVYRINKRKFVEVGLVLENSEFVSSDDEQSDDGHYPDWQPMKKGHVRVAWHPNGVEEVVTERKVKLLDRSLMPGDVVRKLVKGKDTQLGYCRNTNVKATVQVVGTNQVLIGVDSADLIPMEEFCADIAVFYNSWVGMVKVVKSELTVRCSDGSRGIITDIEALDLDDLLDKRDRTSEFKKYSYYPGQQLWGPSYSFENAKWLELNKDMAEILKKTSRSVRVTVEDVKTVSLGVQWVCRAYSVDTTCDIVEQPKYCIEGDELKLVKMMNIFEPCTLQIGDRNYLIIKETYRVVSLNEWKNEMGALLKTDSITLSTAKVTCVPESQNENLEGACNGVDDDSEFEDIDDDNGSVSSDSASTTSHSTTSSVDKSKATKTKYKKGPTLATKILKKKKKYKRARRQVAKEVLPLKTGDRVVTETLITETKANVVWQDGSVERNIPSTFLYPVHHIDSHEFFPGDFVVDSKDSHPHEYGVVKQVDHNGRTALITWMRTYHAGADPHPNILSEQEVSVYDIRDHPDFKYRPGSCVLRVANFEDSNPESTAGQVVDVHSSGKVEVSWVNGDTSLCYPQELYRLGEYDSDELWGDDDSISEEDSWETESEASIVGPDEGNSFEENFFDVNTNEINDFRKVFEKEQKSTEDIKKSVQEKLLANIEKLREGMARLEEVFTQNPTLQTCNVMRRLLELYKHCKVLDQLLGTTYFHEKHLQSLVDRLRQRGRVNSLQHMADQISRLFSVSAADIHAEFKESRCIKNNTEELICLSLTKSETANNSYSEVPDSALSDVANCDSDSCSINNGTDIKFNAKVINVSSLLPPTDTSFTSNSNEPRNICQQLCSILKSRLLKAHEDVELRFGVSDSDKNVLLAENLTPKEKQCDESSPIKQESNVVCSEINEILVPVFATDDTSKNVNDSPSSQGVFSVLESVPDNHKYKLSILQPTDLKTFFKTVRKEMHILKSSLPDGIIVKGFEDRSDLYSVMIKGPKRTPYEDGLFFFDFQFPAEYPKVPPLCHYISYCSDKLNPNLYEGGKVCVSLLGTWGGKGTEVWSPESSNLLQVLVSIQGLILVSEPYFNEAGYERQRGTQQGRENSRMYNEMVVLKLVQAMTKLVLSPPDVFKEEILDHFNAQAAKLIQRLEKWLTISESWNSVHPTTPTSPTAFKKLHGECTNIQSAQDIPLPEFPLIPASKGFCLTLRKSLTVFKESLTASNIFLS